MTARQTSLLIRLYHEAGVAVDQLPYSDTIAGFVRELRQRLNVTFTEKEVYQALIRLRKAKLLVRVTS